MVKSFNFFAAVFLGFVASGPLARADHNYLGPAARSIAQASADAQYLLTVQWLRSTIVGTDADALALIRLCEQTALTNPRLAQNLAASFAGFSNLAIQELQRQLALKLRALQSPQPGMESARTYHHLAQAISLIARSRNIAEVSEHSISPHTNSYAPAAVNPIPSASPTPEAKPRNPKLVWKRARKQPQYGNMWCWAACVQDLLHQLGSKISQREIVTRELGGPYDQGAQSAEQVAKVFNVHAKKLGAKALTPSRSIHKDPSKIKKLIDEGYKIIVFVGTPYSGHVTVAENMDAKGNIALYDPGPGQVFKVPYRRLLRSWWGSVAVKPPPPKDLDAVEGEKTKPMTQVSVVTTNAAWEDSSENYGCFSERGFASKM